MATMTGLSFEVMPQRIFRFLGSARFKPQRRSLYAWIAFVFLFCLLLYYEQSYLSARVTERQIENDVEKRIDTLKKVGEEGDGAGNRFAGVKLLDTEADKDEADDESEEAKLNSLGGQAEEDETRSDLIPDLAPSTIHFVWCGRKYFEFRHYLSVKRADALIKPDKIIFHHRELPLEDKGHYYTWFNQTLSEMAHIVLKPINTSLCPTDGAGYYMLVLRILESSGGIFVPVDALLVDFPVHLRAASFLSGVAARTMSDYLDGVIVAKKNGFISPSSQNGLNIVLASGKSSDHGEVKPCGTIMHFNTEEDGDCLCVKIHKELYPSDVWLGRAHFDSLSRLAAYGAMEVHPRFSDRSQIPRIGHYICWDCELKFSTYLSVLSSLHVAGLLKVYIHGIKEPSGVWWARLKQSDRVIYIKREYPEHTYDQATMTQELAQGIMRITILLKYGGVYCDNKVIWTNAIPSKLFGFEAVASPGWHEYGMWPDSVSHSSIMAKKNSEYLLRLRDLHHQNMDHRFWFVDQYLSYKILEQHPQVLFLDRHFQVKCLNHRCHPTWHSGYKAPVGENPIGQPFHMQNDTVSIHWDVFPELELDTVKYTSGAVVEVARMVLRKAGVSLHGLHNRS